MKFRLSVILLVGVGFAAPASAQNPGRGAPATGATPKAVPAYVSRDPIDIRSDRLEAHNKERKVVFIGNVQARQRDVLIFADRLTTYYDKEGNEVERIVANGNVKITQEDKVGTSHEAIFENRSRKLLLIGDPHLWQGKDELRGERITVYLDEDRVLVDKARGVFTPNRVRPETEAER